MRSLIYPLLIALLLSLFSCGGGGTLENKQQKLDSKREELIALKEEIRLLERELRDLGSDVIITQEGKLVSALTTKPKPFEHYVEFQGTADSEENISVSTDMGGLVTAIHSREGQKVSKGQVLIELDNSLIVSNIEELETALELSNTIYEKQKRLWEKNIGSQLQYLQAKGERDNLQNKLNTAKMQLEKTRIKAPVNGTVDRIFLKLGEMASPGRPAVRVVNLKKIEIEAEVPESYVGDIGMDDLVLVDFPALGKEIKGKIKSIGQVIDAGNRTFTVEVSVPNESSEIKPNLLANIKIKDYGVEEAISIPNRLVQEQRGGYFVFVVQTDEDGKLIARRQTIELGKSYQGQMEVTRGLEGVVRLVDEGYRDVVDGEQIRLLEVEN